jgi:Putative adipose-regulatory protein (Seipin)
MRSSEPFPFISDRPRKDQYRRMNEPESTNVMIVTRQRRRTPGEILLRESQPISHHVNSNESTFHHFHTPLATEHHSEGLLSHLFRWIQNACYVVALGILSIFTYHALYTLFIVPSPNIVKDLYFDYSQRNSDSIQSAYTLIPTATVDLFWTKPLSTDTVVYNTEGTLERPPLSSPLSKKMKPLKPQQSYSIDVQFLLPDSPVNRHASMFTVQTELYSATARANSTTPNWSGDAELDAKYRSVNGSAADSSDSVPDDDTSNSRDDWNDTNSSISIAHHAPREWIMLAQSRRSYRFPFHSIWITTLCNMILIVPILWNYYHFDTSETSWESHWVYGTSFPHYMEISSFPLVRYGCSGILTH